MTDPIIEKVIHDAMPNARIVTDDDTPLHPDGRSARTTPSAQAMLAKWGNGGFLRSSAHIASLDSDLSVEIVEINDASLPPSLRKQTVVVDKKKRKIVSISG